MTKLAPITTGVPPPLIGKAGALSGAVILIGDRSDAPASAMRSALLREAATVIWRRSMRDVTEKIEAGGLALVLLDMDLPGGDPIDLVRRIRFGELGDNPFVPIMMTSVRREGQVILAALLAGVDDVLAKPVSPVLVSRRIQRLAVARKPFVAASDYIGPVRARMAHSLQRAKQFEPPNALKAAILGQSLTGDGVNPEFMQARDRLTVLRLEWCAREIVAAAGRALDVAAESKPSAADLELLVNGELLRRLVGDIPAGNLRDAVQRLAALIGIAASAAEDAVRATRLTMEIANAVAVTVEQRKDDVFAFPADIVARIDARFPGIIE